MCVCALASMCVCVELQILSMLKRAASMASAGVCWSEHLSMDRLLVYLGCLCSIGGVCSGDLQHLCVTA